MKTSILCASLLVVAAFAMSLPSAHADSTTCDPSGATNACVNTWSYDSDTSTDCSGASGGYVDHDREIYASENDGSTYRGAYVYNYCYAYNFGSWSGSGSGLGAGYYSYDTSTWQFTDLGLDWYGYSYSSPWYSGSHCDSGIYSYGNSPVPDGFTSLGCPAGNPPMIIPTLP